MTVMSLASCSTPDEKFPADNTAGNTITDDAPVSQASSEYIKTENQSMTTKADCSVQIIKNGETVCLEDDELTGLIQAAEKSFENNIMMINIMISQQDIEAFGENGLSVLIDYPDGKKIKVSDIQITVEKIQILIDGEKSYVRYLSGSNSEVFVLSGNAFYTVMSYFE